MKIIIANRRNFSGLELSHQLMFILSLLIIFSLIACSKDELAQKPPNKAETLTIYTKPSTFGALVSIPISEISRIVNSKIPNSFSRNGHGKDACAKILGKKVCVGTRYSFTVNNDSEVMVTAVSDKTIRTSLPISFSGNGGFRGRGAEILDLNEKNFNGALILHADLTPSFTEDWCPQLDTSVSYSWNSDPKVEIIDTV